MFLMLCFITFCGKSNRVALLPEEVHKFNTNYTNRFVKIAFHMIDSYGSHIYRMER